MGEGSPFKVIGGPPQKKTEGFYNKSPPTTTETKIWVTQVKLEKNF